MGGPSTIEWTEKHTFDPDRHRLWRVEFELAYDGWAVAATEEEAIATVAKEATDELRPRDYVRACALPQTKPITGPDATSLPWGPIYHGGKELTVNEVIALVRAPKYDTSTQLMPFMDSPPPLRGETPDPSLIEER